jgi:RNA polymerase sigma-70 factor, ECF subfamily
VLSEKPILFEPAFDRLDLIAVTCERKLQTTSGLRKEIPMRTAADQVADLTEMNHEQHLIEKAQAGDQRAFEKLIFKYDRYILGLTLRLLGNRDEAKEVYQETFLKVFRSIGRFRQQSSFYTWVFRIATNVCLDRLRHRMKLLQEMSMDSPSSECVVPFKEVFGEESNQSHPGQALSAVPVRERFRRVLNTLSAEERLVFELRHYQGLRLSQIGEILGSTENTIKDCFYRATRKLRAELTRAGSTTNTQRESNKLNLNRTNSTTKM